MTSSALTSEFVVAARPARSPRPWGEFLCVGGATCLLWPLLVLLRQVLGLDETELAVGCLTFYGAHLLNDPHFSVTYLLFYRDAKRQLGSGALPGAQRFRYVLAGVVAPAVLLTWAALAFWWRAPALLGWLTELMFLLVGWHYVKQGFGVLCVLAARRGVALNGTERRALLLHCFSGWAYAWASPARAAGLFEEKGIVYRSPAHPSALAWLTLLVFFASSVWLLRVLWVKWRRERPVQLLLPLCAFLISVWVWTIYSSFDPLLQYLIPALHSLQYLYFVWLLRRNEARAQEAPPFFGRPASARLAVLALSALALGWFFFHGAPALLDNAFVARGRHAAWLPSAALGPTPFFAAIFAIVNIHHYCMDYVIWRRDNPETRYLQKLYG